MRRPSLEERRDPNLPEGNVNVAELNGTQASLLGFLHRGPMTGWDLLDEIGRGLGRFWNLTTSHVYRELKSLEERGLIEPGETGPRERRPFAITRKGRDAFAAWIAEEPGPEQIRVPLLVSLWFGEHLDPARLRGFIASHRRVHAERLARYREVLDEIASRDAYRAAVVQFGIRYEEAMLGWLDEIRIGARSGARKATGRTEPRVGRRAASRRRAKSPG
jgi:DNA-binding PadR family transcriptional regulator